MLKMYLMASFLGDSSLTLLPMCSLPLCLLMKQQNGSVKTKLALIGKGLTFDSGGYNINAGTGSSIELMKFDMGGSAAVLGAAKAIGKIKRPGVEVHFIVAAFENMISGTGMRDLMMSSQPQTERPLRSTTQMLKVV
ncbi:BnaC02g01380D [Brassica napus]|uniref:BnaC02g01380D protein n=1 Tax=Brassica napus TaxID=3708 RepID=A0A078FLU3_BRANA|nr:BnaC02g01380D [Brassica napus]